MAGEVFENLPDVYEALVDWSKRLAHEAPFYRRVLERVAARSVLDAACGTGHHAAMFQSWGLRVEAADASQEMIRRAEARLAENGARHLLPAGPGTDGTSVGCFAQKVPGTIFGPGAVFDIQWRVRRFEQPVGAAEPFDVAICVGNSLPLAQNKAVARQAVRRLLEAVRPGGLVVVHAMNLWRLPDGPVTWQKCFRWVPLPGSPAVTGSPSDGVEASTTGQASSGTRAPFPREVQIIKGVHRAGRRGYVDLVVADADSGSLLRGESVPLLGLEAAALDRMARQGGAAAVSFFGDYDQRPYDRQTSVDLIMVAERQV